MEGKRPALNEAVGSESWVIYENEGLVHDLSEGKCVAPVFDQPVFSAFDEARDLDRFPGTGARTSSQARIAAFLGGRCFEPREASLRSDARAVGADSRRQLHSDQH